MMLGAEPARHPSGSSRFPRPIDVSADLPDSSVKAHEPTIVEIQARATDDDVNTDLRIESKLGAPFVFVVIAVSRCVRRRSRLVNHDMRRSMWRCDDAVAA